MKLQVAHADWLDWRGYTRFDNRGLPLDNPNKVMFSKQFETSHGDLHINVNAWHYPDMPGGTRYEVDAQLNGSLTMNVTLFTLFDHNLVERLPGIERYLLRLNAAFCQEDL